MFSKLSLAIGVAVMLVAVAPGQNGLARAGQLRATRISSTILFPGAEVRHVLVSYSDLNLKNPADLATLYHRITVAAGYACGSRYFLGSHAVSTFWMACKRQAVKNAVASLNLPGLAAVEHGRVTVAHSRSAPSHRTRADG